MQPLTPQVWSDHFAQLRPHLLEEFPDVDPIRLDVARGDWNHLVEVVQDATGWSADKVEQAIRTMDVEELGLGTGDDRTEEEPAGEFTPASLDQLRLGTGFSEDERPRIVERLSKLNRRLKRFPADGTELELSIKERDTSSQTVVLECWLPGWPTVVARSQEADLRDAIMDCREDLWRQIDDMVNKRIPRG